MAQFTWQSDIPPGVLKNHHLSNQLVEASISEAIMWQFCTPEESYGLHKGETFSWTRRGNIPEQTSIVLSETDRIPEYSVPISVRGAVVQEIGGTVPFTSFARDLSALDLTNVVQRGLKDNLALGLDNMASVAFKDTKIKMSLTTLTGSSIATTGTFPATSVVNITTAHIDTASDYLYGVLKTPYYDDGKYMAVFNYQGIRGIMNDPDWARWHQYTDADARYNHEVGMWDRVRFMETNHDTAFGKVGTGAVLGEGVIFGYDPCKLGEAMTPELRAGVSEDLGRRLIVGFYGIIRFASTWGDSANAGEANILHVGSL